MLYYELAVPRTDAEIEALAQEYAQSLGSFQANDRANNVFLFVDIELTRLAPEVAWRIIVRAVELVPDSQRGLIGASALETLLNRSPAQYIPLTERQALSSPAFRSALGHVWRSGMPIEWWQRLHAFVAGHPEWHQETPEA